MTVTLERDEAWVTVPRQCDCGRRVLWKASLNRLERHGLDPLAHAQDRVATHSEGPPAAAFDALHQSGFACPCSRRVPVVETLSALFSFSRGAILWEGKAHS